MKIRLIRSTEIRVTAFATIALLLWLGTAVPAKAFKFPGLKSANPTAQAKCEAVKEKPVAEKHFVESKVLIKAPPEVVWFSVHEERKHDPDLSYSKVIEQGVNEQKLEQKFCLIPVIGSAVCLMHHTEVPNQRIDYKLLKSDHFKAMEGSWILTPAENGKSTYLQLRTHLDMGVPVPKMVMNSMTQKKLDKRLAHVKEMAEGMHAKVAATETPPPQ